MLGDVLLITDKHKKAAKIIINHINGISKLDKFVISIGGESGTGKSEISHEVAKTLNKKNILTKILHTDNFYKIHPKKRSEWRKGNGFKEVGLNEIDWNKVNECVEDFKKGRKSRQPCIDLVSQEVDELITDYNKTKVLIVDGLYALNADANFRVMIDLTYHETKKAQIKRGKETLNIERLNVLEAEHKAVQSLREKADMLINEDFDCDKTYCKINR
ncbi:uridine kinase [Candidatus Woesearchaeota archaeon]|nr:uridine kinase [Candidatus Woesearchaeota archaeon]